MDEEFDSDADEPGDRRRICLKEIIESGELVPGDSPTIPRYRFEADLLATGVVVFQGEESDNPSLAGKAASGKVVPGNKKLETAGWDFWHYQHKNGSWPPLKQAREEYLAHHPELR